MRERSGGASRQGGEVVNRSAHLEGKEQFDAATVERSTVCELGKWILSEETSLGKLPEFVEVRDRHAAFHKIAGKVLRAASREQSLKLLEWNTEFGKATNDCCATS